MEFLWPFTDSEAFASRDLNYSKLFWYLKLIHANPGYEYDTTVLLQRFYESQKTDVPAAIDHRQNDMLLPEPLGGDR